MGFIKNEWKQAAVIAAVFLGVFYLPVGQERFDHAVIEALALLKWYAKEHVLLCLVPAFFIAGGVSVFLNKNSVVKYLGAQANKFVSYSVAAVSGVALAVCSCTVLPLFSGIYKRGAGLGPATTFLYSGPAISILAIVLTANVLGFEMGLARAIGAIGFSIVIGLLMQFFFRNETREKSSELHLKDTEHGKSLWITALFFLSMVGVLVFANWGAPQADAGMIWKTIFARKWVLAGAFLFMLATILITKFSKKDVEEWTESSWGYAKQILPLLFIGVLMAGLLLGQPGGEGLIPSEWIAQAVGGNSFRANFLASFSGAFMYFATLTEIPILQGLLNNGMGKGPALALLLAGPALSLPNMLVIRSVLGTKKTVTYVGLVIVMATFSGWFYGTWF